MVGELGTASKKEYETYLETALTGEATYSSGSTQKRPVPAHHHQQQSQAPVVPKQFFASQHRKLSSRDKRTGTPDLLSKSQISHKRNDSNFKPPSAAQVQKSLKHEVGRRQPGGKGAERPKTPTLSYEGRDTTSQTVCSVARPKTGKKEVGRTFHAEYEDQEEDYRKIVPTAQTVDQPAGDSEIDMTKVMAFLHSPPSARPAPPVESRSARSSTKSAAKSGPDNNKVATAKSAANPPQSERSLPSVMMKRMKANNIVTHAKTLEGHRNTVNCMCICEGMLWSGSKDRTVAVWDYKANETGTAGSILERLNVHRGSVTCLCPVPMSGLIATGAEDQRIRLWSAQDRKMLGSFLCKGAGIECMTAKDPTQIISGNTDHSIRVM